MEVQKTTWKKNLHCKVPPVLVDWTRLTPKKSFDIGKMLRLRASPPASSDASDLTALCGRR